MPRKARGYPTVSIIIVNYNGRELLKRCLTSLLATSYPNFEIIVVDNASTDGSVESITSMVTSEPQIKLVLNAKNVGHAEGCNIGARGAKGQYFVFLDSDTEVIIDDFPATGDLPVPDPRKWLSELVNVMEQTPSVGIAQAKILLAKNPRFLDYTCMAIDALGSWQATYGLREDELKEQVEIFAASTGCCIVRRTLFYEVGGFDSSYFIYDDDTDLSMRVRLLGYNILFVPSAVIIHHGGVLKGITKRTVYHSSKNRIRTLLKNYELGNLWWRFLTLSFLTLMVAVGFAASKKREEAKATVKGLTDSLKNLRSIWGKRQIIQAKRRIRDVVLIKKGLIRNDVQCTLQDFKLKLRQMATHP